MEEKNDIHAELMSTLIMFDRISSEPKYDIKVRRAALEAGSKCEKISNWIRAEERAKRKDALGK